MPWAEGEALFGLAIAHRLSRIGGDGGIPLNFQRETLSPRLAAADAAFLFCQIARFAVVKR